MRILRDIEEKEARHYMEKCAEIAARATCERSFCGSIIVKNGQIIGAGFNSPPGHMESQRRCHIKKSTLDPKVTDKTCCIHAEQRAIMNAMQLHPDKIQNSELYFIRLDKDKKKTFAKHPYCTICSKMALDAGIKKFILWHEYGICVYDTEEYNKMSYKYSESNQENLKYKSQLPEAWHKKDLDL